MTPFEKAFSKTIQHEGGYSNDPTDPGKETFMGISRVFFPNWQGWEIIDQARANNQALSLHPELPPLVRNFYRDNFWLRFNGNAVAERSEAVAIDLFDCSVNLEVHKAVKWLQEALNVLNDNATIYPDMLVDGIVGKKTLYALQRFFDSRPTPRSQKEKMLLNTLHTLRGWYYIELMRNHPEKERWRGWMLRL